MPVSSIVIKKNKMPKVESGGGAAGRQFFSWWVPSSSVQTCERRRRAIDSNGLGQIADDLVTHLVLLDGVSPSRAQLERV